MDVRIGKLSEGQREALRLYFRRLTAAEIAGRLGVSTATVHQRLTVARRALGVTSSMEAARLLAEAEDSGLYDRAIYDRMPVDEHTAAGLRSWVSRLRLPWRTRRRPSNDMSFLALIISVIVLAALFMILAGGYFLAIALLSARF